MTEPAEIRSRQSTRFSTRTLLYLTLAVLVATSCAAVFWSEGRLDEGMPGMIAIAVVCVCFFAGEFVRQRFRIGMRGMLIAFTLVAIVCGLFGARAYRARQQRTIVQAIQSVGGIVTYDYENTRGNWVVTSDGLTIPRWLEKLVGRDMCGKVTHAYISDATDQDIIALKFRGIEQVSFAGTQITDKSLPSICQSKNLTHLNLWGTKVTDEGLRELHQLPRLETLDLTDTRVSDRGLATLAEMKNLKTIILIRCTVTTTGIERLIKSLPHVRLIHSAINTRVWTKSQLQSLYQLTKKKDLLISTLDTRDSRQLNIHLKVGQFSKEDLALLSQLGDVYHLQISSPITNQQVLRIARSVPHSIKRVWFERVMNLKQSTIDQLRSLLPNSNITINATTIRRRKP